MSVAHSSGFSTARNHRHGFVNRLVVFALFVRAMLQALFMKAVDLLRPTKFGRAHARAELMVPTVTRASVAGPVMTIGRAILVAVVILIVLGELYATDIVANPDNPNTFTNLTSTFASYGETAYIMVGLGLIALGASVALSFFGGFGGGGR